MPLRIHILSCVELKGLPGDKRIRVLFSPRQGTATAVEGQGAAAAGQKEGVAGANLVWYHDGVRRISVREHFRRIAKATEEDYEEHLAGLTVETACRASAGLLALSRYFDLTPREETGFVPLAELIRRHRARRGNRTSHGAEGRRRRP